MRTEKDRILIELQLNRNYLSLQISNASVDAEQSRPEEAVLTVIDEHKKTILLTRVHHLLWCIRAVQVHLRQHRISKLGAHVPALETCVLQVHASQAPTPPESAGPP